MRANFCCWQLPVDDAHIDDAVDDAHTDDAVDYAVGDAVDDVFDDAHTYDAVDDVSQISQMSRIQENAQSETECRGPEL